MINIKELAYILSDNGVCIDGRISVENIASEIEALVTRAVRDVPELVRYDVQGHGMAHMFDGDYVRYDQAAAIIAAEQQKTKDAEELAFRMDRFAQKYLSHMRNSEQRAEAAEAKLAQYEAQEPVAWHTEDHLNDKSATTYSTIVRDRWIDKGWPISNLYASPAPAADPRAEIIETCRKAVRNAVLKMSPEHRANAELCDDVIYRAIATVKAEASNDKG